MEELNTTDTSNISVDTKPKKHRVKRFFRWFFMLLGVGLILTGLGLLYLHIEDPDRAERIVHTAKTEIIDKPISIVKEEVLETYPTLYFNGSGGNYELDIAAAGDWIFLDSYAKVETVLPVWALHNNIGGDIILPWEIGQKFNVVGEGYDGEYIIVDTRDVYKWGLVNQIEGMQGDFALQTCRYGEDVVKFVSAVPLSVYEAGWPPEPQQSSEQQSGETDKIVEIELEGNQHDENL